MILVVADTNSLIAPFKLKFNVDSELERLFGRYQVIVPKPIIGELERLSETSMEARGALKYARACKILPTQAVGDEAVLELADKTKGYIMTNDKALIAKARSMRLRVIRLREGSRLEIFGE